MKVYEARIDYDGNLRESQICSLALFSSREKAVAAVAKEKLLYWQKCWITEKEIK